jgi:hypothetical protein
LKRRHGYYPSVTGRRKDISATYQNPEALRKKLNFTTFKKCFQIKTLYTI